MHSPGLHLPTPGRDYLTSDRRRSWLPPGAPLTSSGAAAMDGVGQRLEYRSNSGAVYSCMSRSIIHAAKIVGGAASRSSPDSRGF